MSERSSTKMTSNGTPQQNPALIISFAMLASSLFLMLGPTLGLIPPPKGTVPADQSISILSIVAASMVFIALFVRKLLLNNPAPNPTKQQFTAHLVSFAILESCALLGFVMTTRTGDDSYSLMFGGLTVVTMLSLWPKNGRP